MWSKLIRIGLIVIVIALLLGNLAVCVESINAPQIKNPQTENPQTKNPQKCSGSKPDECNGKCVNFQNDKQNCGICGNACNQGEVCKNGKCASADNIEKGTSGNKKSTCTDGKKNGKETDIDCGGPTCPACADEKTCKTDTDCSSGVCAVGYCQAPSCVDQVKNGGETGVDCGGPCNPCTPRKPISGIGNITVLPGQNSPGAPAPNLTLGPPSITPTYLFVLDNCNVGESRSPDTDTDYAGFGVSVGNNIPNGALKGGYVGDLANGPYKIDFETGQITIPDDPNVPVIIGYLITNIGSIISGEISPISGNMDDATKYLINSYVPGSGSPLTFVDKYLGYLYNSYCDGTVAAAKITMNGHDLAQMVAPGRSYSKTDFYLGTDSPTGCGSNSIYYVTWHVKRVS
jgi:hypothetical protein